MIDQLLAYDAIGWDFDGTLYQHPKAERMQTFILEQPQKRHFIITFRTDGMQNRVFTDLLGLYPLAPGPEAFNGVLNISDKAWENWERSRLMRLVKAMTGPMTPWEEYYLEWKGMVCHRLKLPVLVDDRREEVLPGCRKYGIDYVHPDNL